MKKRYLKLFAECVAGIALFCIVIGAIQRTLEPYYEGDSTTIVDGFYQLDEDSVDVLFLGASQMFCTIDAQTLTEEYGIASYDFGASSQNLTMTKYFLQEALKTQSPKLVVVEVCQFYTENKNAKDEAYSWSYDPMPLNLDKLQSIWTVSHNVYDVAQYGFLPILSRHSRWADIGKQQIAYNWGLSDYDYSGRGYLERDHVESEEIAYLSTDDGEVHEIPQETVAAINSIADICDKNNIQLLFFKAPVSTWTRSDSMGVKEFMEENGYAFLEMNDYLDEIGIDANTDFYNGSHLNKDGAKKTTTFLSGYLKENYDLN